MSVIFLNRVKPFGFTLATLLLLGGPRLYDDSMQILSSLADAPNGTRLSAFQKSLGQLTKINWKESAPVVFCNEYSIRNRCR